MRLPRVIPRPSDIGTGLFADETIPAGSRILQFQGPRLTLAEVRTKGALASNTLQVDVNQYLDLETPGRLVNHSCDPNAYVRDDVWLVAARDIAEGEEIRFDYSTTVGDGWTMPCACRSARCRGLVRAYHLLPRDVRMRYDVLQAAQRFLREGLGA